MHARSSCFSRLNIKCVLMDVRDLSEKATTCRTTFRVTPARLSLFSRRMARCAKAGPRNSLVLGYMPIWFRYATGRCTRLVTSIIGKRPVPSPRLPTWIESCDWAVLFEHLLAHLTKCSSQAWQCSADVREHQQIEQRAWNYY